MYVFVSARATTEHFYKPSSSSTKSLSMGVEYRRLEEEDVCVRVAVGAALEKQQYLRMQIQQHESKRAMEIPSAAGFLARCWAKALSGDSSGAGDGATCL